MEQIQTEMTAMQRHEIYEQIQNLFFDISRTNTMGGCYVDTNDKRVHVVVYTQIDTITTFETDKIASAGFRIAQIAFEKDSRNRKKEMRLDLVRMS